MSMLQTRMSIVALVAGLWLCGIAGAEEREVTAEQEAAVAGTADEIVKPTRPANLPDYTKGAAVPAKTLTRYLGPTGIEGVYAGGFGGDQFLVQRVAPGSPAVGKVLPGDVLLGGGLIQSNAGTDPA